MRPLLVIDGDSLGQRDLEVATMRRDLPIAIPDDAELDPEPASVWRTEAGMLRLAARLAG